MTEQKLAGILGLATRARQTAAGMEASLILIRSGKCGVLLMDSGSGPNTRKKAEELCRKKRIPILNLPAGLIGTATGKGSKVIAVCEGSFAEQLLKLYEGNPNS